MGKDNGGHKVQIKRFYIYCKIVKETKPPLDAVEVIKPWKSIDKRQKYKLHYQSTIFILNCLALSLKGYKKPIMWLISKDKEWYNNNPLTKLVDDERCQNGISRR